MTKTNTIIKLPSKPIMCSSESYSELVKFSNINEQDKSFNMILMLLDTISRNGSMYAGADFKRSFEESRYMQEMLRNNVLFGELQHPDQECTQSRFMSIDHNNISHGISNIVFNGNRVLGKVTLLPPKGDIVWEWMKRFGSNLAMSVRVLTPTYVTKTTESGQKYIYKYSKSIPITWDCVFVPGFEEARVADIAKYNASIESFITTMELSDTDASAIRNSHKNYTKEWNITDSDLKNLMKSQEATKILEDLFEFSIESSNVVLGNEAVNVKISDKKTIIIPTDTYLVSSVLGTHKKIRR